MGKTTELRRELKRTFVHFAKAHGFELDQRHAPQFLEFRRLTRNELHVFDIQWEKYGKQRFVINFGKCTATGVEFNGEILSPDQINSSHCSGRGRLQPGKGAMTSSWFRQDKPFIKRLLSRESCYPAEQIVEQLMALFPELEAYWQADKIGPHMRTFHPLHVRDRNAL